jgi:hypothetical protein
VVTWDGTEAVDNPETVSDDLYQETRLTKTERSECAGDAGQRDTLAETARAQGRPGIWVNKKWILCCQLRLSSVLEPGELEVE